jgi:hypothetical protein
LGLFENLGMIGSLTKNFLRDLIGSIKARVGGCADKEVRFERFGAAVSHNGRKMPEPFARFALDATRLDRLGDPAAYLISEAPFMAQLDVLHDLVGTAPSTFAGLQAWAGYLAEINHCDEAWMFEDEAPTLIVTLVEALGNLAVAS